MKDWTILDELKDDERRVEGSVVALVGPKSPFMRELFGELGNLFQKVYIFHIPDDYGEFPDTMGYTSKDFKNLESDMEDPALFPFMQKALDAVVDFNNKRQDTLDRLGYMDIEGFLHAPKFGGKVWAVAGFVRAFAPDYLNKSKIIVPGTIH